jgi:8-amino-7-oxononanoate synthase
VDTLAIGFSPGDYMASGIGACWTFDLLLFKLVDMSSLDEFAVAKLAKLDAAKLKRTLAETLREDGLWVMRGGRRLLSFSCNDYLNLTQHPAVKQAAIRAIEEYGTGAGASRLVTGNHPLLMELENRLAAWKGTQACCVFGSGYLANAGIIPVLVGGGDLLVVDELAHSCIWAGAQLSRAQVEKFRHNDLAHAEQIIAEHRKSHTRALIVTEGVFSMDGDRAPLEQLGELAAAHDAWLMSDDAHGLGVLNEGRGSGRVDLQMGTLSKALASYGGYVCASTPVIDLIKTRAATLIYSTGLPPSAAAAALAALDIVQSDPALTARPLANARLFTRALNLPQAQSPIVPLILGHPAAALDAAKILEDEGFLVIPIRPPTVPAGTARLRFAFTAGHGGDDIARLADVLRTRILA